jgi:predicted MPP superfamily phosphohydrolase
LAALGSARSPCPRRIPCAFFIISDLHRAGSTETLKAIWGGPQSALRKLPEAEQRFDLIVVSGDLAGTARPRRVQPSCTSSPSPACSRLLRDPEARARVIFVPGNHDVDWSAELGRPLQLADLLQQAAGSEQPRGACCSATARTRPARVCAR